MAISNTQLSDFNNSTYIKLETLQSKVNEYIDKKIQLVGQSNLILNQNDINSLYNRNQLDSLYIDSSMIVFLYSILPLYDFNPSEFYMLLKGTNNILKIRKQIEDFYSENLASRQTESTRQDEPPPISFKDPKPKVVESLYTENINEMFEIAIGLKINCLNNIQNIIYKVPKNNAMYTYIDNVLERYSVLISRNLEIINRYHLNSIRDNGINTRTKFVYYTGTKGYDRMSNQNIIPTKNLGARAELHQLYV